MIPGFLREEAGRRRPFLEAFVDLASHQQSGTVEFLVDTGADNTVLSPRDAALLGINVALLPPGVSSTGVGGTTLTVTAPARLSVGPHTYFLDLRILAPQTGRERAVLEHIPSLLGRDVLAHFALFYEDGEDLVLLLEPDEARELRRNLPSLA